MGYKFTARQIELLNGWPRSEPALRGEFNLYTSPGFGDLLDALNALFDVSTKTTNYTIQDGDRIILADATAGNITITLPTPITDRVIWIKKINNSGGNVIIDPGDSTIDDASSLTITIDKTSYTLSADGEDWHII